MSRRIASIAAVVVMLINVPASAMAQALLPGSSIAPVPGSIIAPAAPAPVTSNGLTIAPGFNYSDPNSGLLNPGGVGPGGGMIAPGAAANGQGIGQIGAGGVQVAPGPAGQDTGTNLLTTPQLNPLPR